jgi:alpha-aminoadipate carrier protein LysW
MAICPDCEFEIDIDEYDVDKGDTLECDNCGARLEVVSLSPVHLDVVTDDDEDEDDEEDDEEDEEDEEEEEQ